MWPKVASFPLFPNKPMEEQQTQQQQFSEPPLGEDEIPF
jgi:hypothetical protein